MKRFSFFLILCLSPLLAMAQKVTVSGLVQDGTLNEPLLGAAVVMGSDTFARTAFAPTELPVGILMAVLGAPFFLFLLRREL